MKIETTSGFAVTWFQRRDVGQCSGSSRRCFNFHSQRIEHFVTTSAFVATLWQRRTRCVCPLGTSLVIHAEYVAKREIFISPFASCIHLMFCFFLTDVLIFQRKERAV